MTGNPRGPHPFSRSTSRKPYKPELDLLEGRDLLSAASGLMPADLVGGVPSGGLMDERMLPPILPPIFRAGLNLSTHFLEVTRGGPAVTYTAALTARPSANVTVTITQARTDPYSPRRPPPRRRQPAPLTVSPTLTFTPENWDQPQTVTVSAPAEDATRGERSAPASQADQRTRATALPCRWRW
jgi:hypothetical protein